MGIVQIYCDGSTITNPGVGAWAAIIKSGPIEEVHLGGPYTNTTNNRMEMLGAIIPLMIVISTKDKHEIEVISDSEYVVKGVSEWIKKWKVNKWRTSTGRSVKNADLYRTLDILMTSMPIKFTWIKGHASNPFNNRCDELARGQAYLTVHKKIDDQESKINVSQFNERISLDIINAILCSTGCQVLT